ncbi:hypothetical protein Q4519_06675 [Motilimonas sp. 1_MG-2023]|uniref:hypothetical protein n=1 Tax=Motilimonas sp. 1_MG-2023 TaxID=3062672 RepID=UPI0026E256D6|nr:hypothetical protein [Motilimonas sp. 1_MG-2023]MDO6525367.1 hypothetical protein [Motilimonas sp. 1_MG-2023]
MINKDKCLELGLPEPKSYQSELSYCLSVMLSGVKLNTWQTRYIGIGHLHNHTSVLKKKGYQFEDPKAPSYCPEAKKILPRPVINAFMMPDQIALYWQEKAARKG